MLFINRKIELSMKFHLRGCENGDMPLTHVFFPMHGNRQVVTWSPCEQFAGRFSFRYSVMWKLVSAWNFTRRSWFGVARIIIKLKRADFQLESWRRAHLVDLCSLSMWFLKSAWNFTLRQALVYALETSTWEMIFYTEKSSILSDVKI